MKFSQLNLKQTRNLVSAVREYIFFFSLFFLSSIGYAADPSVIKQVCVKEQCIDVEIADTPVKRARGLQGKEQLEDQAGMLFVFETQDFYDFWMKDTKIALDMIWIDQHKTVVEVKSNVPVCTADPCEIYAPSAKAKYVLEINAGHAETFNIQTGEQLIFK